MGLLKPTYAKTSEKTVNQRAYTGSGIRANNKHLIYLFALIFVFALSGCVTLPDPETTQDFNTDTVAIINPEQSVGQTFVSHRANFNGIDLWFTEESAGQWIDVELFYAPDDPAPIYTGKLHITGGKNRVTMQVSNTLPNQNYYLRLSTSEGEAHILGRDEDNYILGNAYISDQPVEADLAFRGTYEYDAAAAGADLSGIITNGWLLLPLGILLFLPGWLLLDLSGLQKLPDRGEKIALSLGLSLASIPVLMLWTSLLGLRWGRLSVWLMASLLIIALIWRQFKAGQSPVQQHPVEDLIKSASNDRSAENIPAENADQSSTDHQPSTFNIPPIISQHSGFIILLLIFALTLFTRFAMVRDLAAPAWVDPIHHGLITRLILERGGIPDTYVPYLPPEADYYHFGFHSSFATFIWLTDLEIHTAMLIFGQVLNALIVFAVYLLAKTLTKNQSAALTAALIAGVFTLMPAYYVSWGRYTQLAGLLVLPTAFALLTKTVTSPKKVWLLTAITLAGLFLIHYRVAAFFSMLILAYLLTQVNLKTWLKIIGPLILLGVSGAIILLPWLPDTISDLLVPKGQTWNGAEASFSQIPWNFLKPGLGEAALILAGIGLILGLMRLKRFPLTILLWTGLMYLLANLSVFGLPGSGFVNPVSMEITLFIPIAVLGGFSVAGTLEILDKWIPTGWQVLPRLIFITLGTWTAVLGAQRLLPVSNPITFLARSADFPAIQWVTENIPEDETILINPTGWGYGLYMGNDGGYWISALTPNQTIPPAVLYGLGNNQEVTRVNEMIQNIQSVAEDADALWDLLQGENIRFVFIGARGGILSPRALGESDLFEVRYQQDGTWLFEATKNSP